MDDPLGAMFWRDELLQILYWFRGEGFGEAVAPQQLVVFLDAREEQLRQHLDRLVADGYAERLDGVPARYQLTEFGVKEGGRRFADEFADLTKQGHGECNNPNCACKTLGPQACETRHPHKH